MQAAKSDRQQLGSAVMGQWNHNNRLQGTEKRLRRMRNLPIERMRCRALTEFRVVHIPVASRGTCGLAPIGIAVLV